MRIRRREKYFFILLVRAYTPLVLLTTKPRTSNFAYGKVRGKTSILNGSASACTMKIGRKPLRVRSVKRVHQTAAGGGGRFANYFCARVVDASRGLKAKRISIGRNPLSFFLFFILCEYVASLPANASEATEV